MLADNIYCVHMERKMQIRRYPALSLFVLTSYHVPRMDKKHAYMEKEGTQQHRRVGDSASSACE